MGWTFTNCDRNPNAERELIMREFDWEDDNFKQFPVYHTRRGNVHYLAVKTVHKCDGSFTVFGCVVLTAHDSREYCNFGYKEIYETMGPNESHAPARLIRMLTPTDVEWANEWRQRCLENSKRSK